MLSIHDIADEIIAREGGYVNDPDDPGGATNFGVTIHTLRGLGYDLDRDGDVDAGDVKLLTRDMAKDIFLRHYFEGPRINHLPEALWATVFDMNVNAGSRSVKLLQKLCNAVGVTDQTLSEDGVIGPMTLRAVQATFAEMGKAMVDAYGIERRNFYFRLADKRPKSRKFARSRAGGKGGWIKRAEEFIAPKYHMTDAEFQARVAAWG